MKPIERTYNPDFDWHGFLIKAVDREASEEEIAEAQFQAGFWNIKEGIPKIAGTPVPVDQKLKELGMQFAYFIDRESWFSAHKVLEESDKRERELLEGVSQ